MPIIEITDKAARLLNDAVPSSLKGSRKTTLQVHWLIEEHAKKHDAAIAAWKASYEDETEQDNQKGDRE